MGRRIYDGNEYVYKYTFGRQNSEMNLFSKEFKIGEYRDNKLSHQWIVQKTIDLPKLKKLYSTLLNKHTENELKEIGFIAIKNYIKKQNKKWKMTFKDDIDKINTGIIKSIDDFEYGGRFANDCHFEVYDISAIAIEKKINISYDFLSMTKVFINYIESNNKEDFIFDDEF
jgi:hypothetical protein